MTDSPPVRAMLAVILILSVALPRASADDVGPAELRQVFEAENLSGTLVIASADGRTTFVHNRDRAANRLSPASTFKIVNTLIGLETGVVTSRHSQFTWDGMDRGPSRWNRNQTLESAFKVSCVWCYQEVARDIGTDTYASELERIGYGNAQIGDRVDQFWLNGELLVSALEQVEIVTKIQNYSIGYKRETVDELKAIMLEEQVPDYSLYAKSGWTGPELHVGWYVGYIETENNTWIFAMNMDMDRAEQAPLRKDIVMRSMIALEII